MALPASGPLALTDIQTEFGGANPIGMNEYYAGGGLVPAGTSGTYGAVPSSGALSIQNFYGTSNFVPIYIEDVFSTFLYTGTGASQTITNGVNLSGSGGLVWGKNRNFADNHYWCDSARGTDYGIYSNSTFAQAAGGGTTFNSTGFTVSSSNGYLNANGYPFVSWTFRKQPKFFDVVTYTGTGAGGNVISHNLGSIPGCIIIKATSTTSSWFTWHIGSGISTSVFGFELNSTAAAGLPSYDGSSYFTSTTFLANAVFNSSISEPNQAGVTYVAYLFASNAGGFGLTGSDNVISCGSYTEVSGQATVTLGYEPQWVLAKISNAVGNWSVFDSMRGFPTSGAVQQASILDPNRNAAEYTSGAALNPTSTGFKSSGFGTGSSTIIYIAIRRGPMKVPTVGTSVFTPADTGNDSVATNLNFPIDAFWETNQSGSIYNTSTATRLWGNARMLRTSDYVLANTFLGSIFSNTLQNYYAAGLYGGGTIVSQYGFRRAPQFMDIGAFTAANGSINHNLTIAPELVIYKSLNNNTDWYVCASPNGLGILNSDSAWIATGSGSGLGASWANVTSTTISAASWGYGIGQNMVAYMFATCPGVSKVGSFTGTGSLQTINCGFTTGVRFIIIKRTDSAGDWYLYDSVRGISSGNDPYNRLNSSAANVNGTNYVDTTGVGFQVTAAASGTVNVSGGSYIFLAIA